MNHSLIPIAAQGAPGQRQRQAPKGRRADPQARIEVQGSLGGGQWPAAMEGR